MGKRLSIILVLSMVVFVLSGCILDEEATVTDTNTETTEETTVETTEEENEDDKETEESVDKEEDNQDKETTASEEKEETAKEEVTEEKEETLKPEEKPSTDSAKEENKPSTTTTPATKPETSEVKPSASVENNTPAPETPAVHEHNWVAETIHHDAVTHEETTYTTETTTIHHDGETCYRCCDCGTQFTDHAAAMAHWESSGHDSGFVSDTTAGWDEVVETQVPHTTTVIDQAAWDETIYHCECGATK